VKVQAEMSLYPLRTEHLAPTIEVFCRALHREGLKPEMGPMSTRVSGEAEDVFRALRDAFVEAARGQEVVLTVKISNACPACA